MLQLNLEQPRDHRRTVPRTPTTTNQTKLEILAAFALAGCTPASPPAGSDPAPPAEEAKADDPEPPAVPEPLVDPVQAPDSVTLRAKVDIDDKPGGKRFRGV